MANAKPEDKVKDEDVKQVNQDPTDPSVPSTNPTTAGDATPEDVDKETVKKGAFLTAKNGTITRVPSKS